MGVWTNIPLTVPVTVISHLNILLSCIPRLENRELFRSPGAVDILHRVPSTEYGVPMGIPTIYLFIGGCLYRDYIAYNRVNSEMKHVRARCRINSTAPIETGTIASCTRCWNPSECSEPTKKTEGRKLEILKCDVA